MTNAAYDTKTNHTDKAYSCLSDAYIFFNGKLFGDKLPTCLITYQRKKNARGYYSPMRFQAHKQTTVTDEISLNPATFDGRTETEVLSTLVHEMCHLQQQHFGKPSRGGYHNKQWADMMEAVGLMPSTTGGPDGKKTGPRVTHYILLDDKFDKACKEFLNTFVLSLYSDKQSAGRSASAAKKNASKTPYVCLECDLKAWAKPGANLTCGDCDCPMEVEL